MNYRIIIKPKFMKKIIIVLIAVLICQSSFSQKKDLRLSISSNVYTSTSYPNVKPGAGFSLDMSYFITDKIFIASHANYGKFRYYDDVLSNAPDHFDLEDGTNTSAASIHAGLVIGYNIKISNLLNLHAATGVSSYTLMRRYPYQFDPDTWSYSHSAWTDLAFPVRIGIESIIWERLSLGLIGGFYIEPDFPIVGWHIGPVISYTIK